MKNYVVGFLFCPSQRYVRLIEKKRPEWQAGRLNGIGGKIEDSDESSHAAMVREFKEETGATVTDWIFFASLSGPDWVVDCYTATGDYATSTQTDEELWWKKVSDIDGPDTPRVLDNLRWLIPLALDTKEFGRPNANVWFEK